jgi:hypothetical protein
MRTYDNPSGDKFGPPQGEERFEPPKPRRGPQWFALLLVVAFYVVRYQLEHMDARGWVIPAILAGVFIGEFLVKRRTNRERQTNDPHAPTPNVPR